MATPHIHSQSSAKKWGGKWEDYMEIHKKMDCTKAYFHDARHRAISHTMFWIEEVMLPLFGDVITNSSGRVVSVKDICELHILEDYHLKFIPTVGDFLQEMEMKDWMMNGIKDVPPSAKKRFKNGADEKNLRVKRTEYRD